MIPKTYIDYYGDAVRWFVGHVVDVENDPLKLGRVKVRALGVYDNIKDEDLPWAQIVVPITTGIHEGKGQNLGILKGTQVFGIFLDGQNSQLPMVIGSIPKEGDTNSKANDKYPLNKVYETETGHYKEWDDSEDGRIREQHRSGTFYELQADGSRVTVIEKDDTLTVKGDVKLIVHGNVTADISKDLTANVSGSTKIDCSSTTLTGDLRVDGGVSVGSDVNTDKGISLNNHTHPVLKVKKGSSAVESEKPV
jgi:hypothetical protein